METEHCNWSWSRWTKNHYISESSEKRVYRRSGNMEVMKHKSPQGLEWS